MAAASRVARKIGTLIRRRKGREIAEHQAAQCGNGKTNRLTGECDAPKIGRPPCKKPVPGSRAIEAQSVGEALM